MAQKSPNVGLLMRGPAAPSTTLQPAVHGYIVEVHWNAAQPGTASGKNPPANLQDISAATTNSIDSAVQAVRKYNGLHTRPAATVQFTSGNKQVSFTGTDLTGADATGGAGALGQYIVSNFTVPGATIVSVNAGAHTAMLDTFPFASGTGCSVGQPQGLRIRIETGQYAPPWTAGTASLVNIQDNQNPPNKFTVPPWWNTGVQSLLGISNLGTVMFYYANFMSGLANLALPLSGGTVDTCPEIREVTVGATMDKTGEVMFRYSGTATNNANYVAGGFTGTKDRLAMLQQSQIHAAVFLNTITQIDCNIYDDVGGSFPPGITTDQQFTDDILDFTMGVGAYSSVIAQGLCLTNASLQMSGNGPLYADMQNRGPAGTGDAARNGKCAISFQTYQEPTVNSGNVGAVLARASGFGATSVEIISKTATDTDAAIYAAITASNYDQQMMQNFPSGTAKLGFPWLGAQPVQPGIPGEFPASCTGPG